MHDLNPILSRYSFLRTGYQAVSIGNAGGFSGAEIWKINAGHQNFCLKQWPASHPTFERLAFIHKVLRHVSRQGLSQVAVPLADDAGQTIVRQHGTHYELTPWLPGEADFEQQPSEKKLIAAVTILARFHLLAATFTPIAAAPSPGIVDRRNQLEKLRRGELEQIAAAIQPRDWPHLAQLAREFLSVVPRVAPRIHSLLDRVSARRLPLQPCIRDIWHDHVLFTDEAVTGLIDFGSLRMENVAGDVARLVGSFVGDDLAHRQIAFCAYKQLRPLSPEERELVDVFDQSTTVLGGLNWLRWIYCEGRVFTDRAKVEKRLTFLLRRLHQLATDSS